METHLDQLRRGYAIRHIPSRGGIDARLELVRAMTSAELRARRIESDEAERVIRTRNALANAPALPMRRMGRDPEKTPEFREAWVAYSEQM